MPERTGSRWQSVVETCAIAAIAIAVVWTAMGRPGWNTRAGAVAASSPTKSLEPLPAEPISLSGGQLDGSRSAKAGMVIFSDFQCPFCARFAKDTMPTLTDQYVKTGNLVVVFRQFPLPIHNLAEHAAATAICAGEQGKFWPFHNEIFKAPRLEDGTAEEVAKAVGIDVKTLISCLSTRGLAGARSDHEFGSGLGVQGTPTFLAGFVLPDGRLKVTERFSGALPLTDFQRRLNGLIALATKQ